MPQPYVHRYTRRKPEDHHSVGQLVEVIIGYLEHGARIEEQRDSADKHIVSAFRKEAIAIRKLYETKAPGLSQYRGGMCLGHLSLSFLVFGRSVYSRCG
jgi:hypothetical protein